MSAAARRAPTLSRRLSRFERRRIGVGAGVLLAAYLVLHAVAPSPPPEVTVVVAAHELVADFEHVEGYPVTVNDPVVAGRVLATAATLLGESQSVHMPDPLMGAEDFSFYSQVVPAGFYYVGVRNETLGSVHTGHSPYFMIDEDVLPTGAAVHAAIAERYLSVADAMPSSSSPDTVEHKL